MIRPYLSDTINDPKTLKNLRVYSRNEAIDYETQYGECKSILLLFKIPEKLVLCIPRAVI